MLGIHVKPINDNPIRSNPIISITRIEIAQVCLWLTLTDTLLLISRNMIFSLIIYISEDEAIKQKVPVWHTMSDL